MFTGGVGMGGYYWISMNSVAEMLRTTALESCRFICPIINDIPFQAVEKLSKSTNTPPGMNKACCKHLDKVPIFQNSLVQPPDFRRLINPYD